MENLLSLSSETADSDNKNTLSDEQIILVTPHK